MLLPRGLRSVLSFVVVLVLLAGLPAIAQKITGDISGDVTDSSGAVAPNVTVTAENLATNQSRTITTTNTGSYRIADLPIGSYKVTATAPGFKTLIQNADVMAGGNVHADFRLAVGQRTETVEVEGQAPLVDLSPNNNN